MKLVADDVQTLVIPDCGHWLAEQAPEKLAALAAFLSPYRDHAANEHAPVSQYRRDRQLPMSAAWIDNQHSARHLPVAVRRACAAVGAS
jgi:hypothetical protein